MNSLLFSSLFIVNTEPIEQNLNGIFVNKHGIIQYRMENNEKLQIVSSRIFTLLQKS